MLQKCITLNTYTSTKNDHRRNVKELLRKHFNVYYKVWQRLKGVRGLPNQGPKDRVFICFQIFLKCFSGQEIEIFIFKLFD